MCHLSASSETTVSVQMLFNHPKVTANRKQKPLLPAKIKGNGSLYFRKFTVYIIASRQSRAPDIISFTFLFRSFAHRALDGYANQI